MKRIRKKNNKNYTVLIFFAMFILASPSLYALPGQHESYTCDEYRDDTGDIDQNTIYGKSNIYATGEENEDGSPEWVSRNEPTPNPVFPIKFDVSFYGDSHFDFIDYVIEKQLELRRATIDELGRR